MAYKTELDRVRVECQRSKASVQQLKLVRGELNRVSASSKTKAFKRELSVVRTELRKSTASVRAALSCAQPAEASVGLVEDKGISSPSSSSKCGLRPGPSVSSQLCAAS